MEFSYYSWISSVRLTHHFFSNSLTTSLSPWVDRTCLQKEERKVWGCRAVDVKKKYNILHHHEWRISAKQEEELSFIMLNTAVILHPQNQKYLSPLKLVCNKESRCQSHFPKHGATSCWTLQKFTGTWIMATSRNPKHGHTVLNRRYILNKNLQKKIMSSFVSFRF